MIWLVLIMLPFTLLGLWFAAWAWLNRKIIRGMWDDKG